MPPEEFLRIAREALESFVEGEVYGSVRLGEPCLDADVIKVPVLPAESSEVLQVFELHVSSKFSDVKTKPSP